MEKDKKVTALYCRLSKDDGSNSESLSIRTQKSMLMEYATRNGFGNCQYYVDDGYSGTNSDRPAFQELLDDIREGKEWMDSIRFSLFVLLRWLGESFLRYSLKGCYTA